MIHQIMKNEWTLLTREKILYLAIPVYLILLVYGVVNGTQWKTFLADNAAAATQLADEGFHSKQERLDRILAGEEEATYREDPRLPAPFARWLGYEMATKPPTSTAAIAIGQSDVVPSYLKVQWKPMFKQDNTDEIENPRNLAVGTFDLSFVLIYLYPLLIIALSYNILSAEREQGTQVLLLSQPISVSQFVTGKLLLRGALVIGTAIVISVGGLLIANPDIIGSGSWWRVGIFTLLLVLYGLFWLGLSILVNALGKKSSTNALIMIATWIGLVLLLPATLNLAAKTLYPLPSRISMVQALRDGDEQATRQSKFDRAYRADLLRTSEEAATAASIDDLYQKILPLEEQAEAIASPIFERFDSQRRSQQLLSERLKYLSPSLITQMSLNELANHSARNFNHFNDQVEAYHQIWRDYFYRPVKENRILTRDEVRNVPRFTYKAESDSAVMNRLLIDVLALAILSLITMVMGFVILRKYSAAAQ